jgi:hypothetical protein
LRGHYFFIDALYRWFLASVSLRDELFLAA